MRNRHSRLAEKILMFTLVTKSQIVENLCAMFVRCFLDIMFADILYISLGHITYIYTNVSEQGITEPLLRMTNYLGG